MGSTKGIVITTRNVYWIVMTFLIAILVSAWIAYRVAYFQLSQVGGSFLNGWQTYVEGDRRQVKVLQHQMEQRLSVLTHHLAGLEAKVLRLNAMGEQLVTQAHLSREEFNFQSLPASIPLKNDPLLQAIYHLALELENKEAHISALMLALQKRPQDSFSLFGSGKPIDNAWVSSFFGHRADPFTGKKAWHAGVDIAGQEGAMVKALASGIVSVASEKGGYGRLVEIKHPKGLATRYGHNKQVLVRPGQWVKKGQAIARLGRSGRATGVHVHLEVLKNGQAIDPGFFFPDLRPR